MITILALTMAIAVVLVPLLQRELRTAHARIEARRRWERMTPLQRSIITAAQQFRTAMAGVGRGMAAFGAAYRETVDEARKRDRERAPWRS